MNCRSIYKALTISILLFCGTGVKAQFSLNNVLAAFNSTPAHATSYFFKNKFKAPAGGHLQGIQPYHANYQPFTGNVILTGSSATCAYYLKVQLNNRVDTLIKIPGSPFRHAGGCQVAGALLFVGVEDNIAKDKADLTAIPLYNNDATVVIKKRLGQYKRSTTGAVGATMLNGRLLIAAGDWNTLNIDFYVGAGVLFDSAGTFSFGSTGPPCAYQSINLVTDTGNHLYLIGLGKEGNSNRADLFLIEDYRLKLIATRLFKTTNGCSFRYGAGINCANAEQLEIYTCQRRLKKYNRINVFGQTPSKH